MLRSKKFFRFFSSSNLFKNEYQNIFGGENISSVAYETFSIWTKTIKEGIKNNENNSIENKEELKKLFSKLKLHVSNDCIFSPPTYYKNWKGCDEFLCIIESVGTVFGSSFEYKRQWLSPNGHEWALEFTAKIGKSNKIIHGIDLVKLDENGKICEFSVLARPPSAVEELKNQMMIVATPKLIALKAKQSISSIYKF